MKSLVVFLVVGLMATMVGAADELALTVYNNDLGLIRQVRELELQPGVNIVKYDGIAEQIDATSVSIVSESNPADFVVEEQNYEYDLVSPDKLLKKFLGENVVLEGKGNKKYQGKLLSYNGQQVVLKGEAGVELVNVADNINSVFLAGEADRGLIVKPTLVWQILSKQGGLHRTVLSYLTSGINWKADYVATVNDDDTKLDLTGWVTINNQSGAEYPNARLKLIAGDVRRVERKERSDRLYLAAVPKAMMEEERGFEEKSFFEYHLYTLGRKTTIKRNEIKQVTLLTASQVPINKVFIYDHNRNDRKVMVNLELKNAKENNMGIPLPKGKVRVYKADTDKSLQFIGEDEIDHTPKDETVRLYIGDAFDLVGEWKHLDENIINICLRETTSEATIRNHKSEEVEVKIIEYMWGWSEWKVLEVTPAEAKWKKASQERLEITIKVPANGEVKVTYKVRVRSC